MNLTSLFAIGLSNPSNIVQKFHNFSVLALSYIRYGILFVIVIYFLYQAFQKLIIQRYDEIYLLSVKCLGIYIAWLIFELVSINYIV